MPASASVGRAPGFRETLSLCWFAPDGFASPTDFFCASINSPMRRSARNLISAASRTARLA